MGHFFNYCFTHSGYKFHVICSIKDIINISFIIILNELYITILFTGYDYEKCSCLPSLCTPFHKEIILIIRWILHFQQCIKFQSTETIESVQ